MERLGFFVIGVAIWALVGGATNLGLSIVSGRQFLPWPVAILGPPLIGVAIALFERRCGDKGHPKDWESD